MKLRDEIRGVLGGHGETLVAYLYGSTVKGYGGRGSDVDVGVLLREGFEAEALYRARIAGEIRGRCGLDREVDVGILNKGSYRFLHQVIGEGEVILSTDEGERVRFETSVVDGYIDLEGVMIEGRFDTIDRNLRFLEEIKTWALANLWRATGREVYPPGDHGGPHRHRQLHHLREGF